MENSTKTIILADNQPITRVGIIELWNCIASESTILTASNKADLMKLADNYPEAIVLIDYSLFDFPGLDSLLIISQRFPKLQWILFNDDLSETFLNRVLMETNYSIVFKDSSLEEITQALEYGISQKKFICSRVKSQLQARKELAEKQVLTATEREILKFIALGKKNQQIADERCASIHTIATHRKSIFRKIGVNNALEAAKYAAQMGLVDLSEYYI